MRRIAILLVVPALMLMFKPEAPASETAKSVIMAAAEYGFAPSAIAVKVGQRLEIRITNKGKMDHEFLSTLFKAAKDVEIKVEGVKVEADGVEEVEFEPGKTVLIELTPTKAGTFQFWCGEKFQGKLHRDLGMKGAVQVTR